MKFRIQVFSNGTHLDSAYIPDMSMFDALCQVFESLYPYDSLSYFVSPVKDVGSGERSSPESL